MFIPFPASYARAAWRALLTASCCVGAHAQPPTPAPEAPALPTVTVTDTEPGSPTVPSVARQREAIEQTAGSVGFIDNATLLDRYQANLHDVLQDAPGVVTQNRYGQELRLSIRGSGIARGYHVRGIELLQDGIPTNLADGSGDLYEIDPMGLRTTEIYKGGNALGLGASTLGGAINFITPTAYTAIAPNIVQVSGGSFGSVQTSGQVSRVAGDLDWLANLTASHADGWRAHETGNYGQFNGNLGYRLGPSAETRFYLGVYATNQLLPGTLSLADALGDPRKAGAGVVAQNQARDMRVQRLANRTSVALGGGRLDVNSWLIHTDMFHPIFQVLTTNGDTWGVAPRYARAWQAGSHRNEMTLCARVFGGSYEAQRFVNQGGAAGAPTLDARQKALNVEAYLENRTFVTPRLAFVAGVKALRHDRDYINHGVRPGNPDAATDRVTYSGLNPKIGLLWEPREHVQVFANLTRSQDVPDFTDLTQTFGATSRFVPLASQRAWTAEIGTRGQHGLLRWDATYYRSRVRGEMLQYTLDPTVPATTFNADRTLHQGIELGASLTLARNLAAENAGDRLELSQMWNWSDFRFQGDPQHGDNAIPGLPRHVLRTALSYTRADGFYVTPTLDWVPGGAWVDYANTTKTPGYALLGLKFGATLRDGLSFYVDLRTLTNRRYVADFAPVLNAAAAPVNTFYPGLGRSIHAGMRYQF